MRKIVVASHGEMAKGMENTLALFSDESQSIHYLCGYTDGLDFEEKISRYFADAGKEDEIIVLTDLFGGSVNSVFLPYLSRPGLHLIAGFNLGLVLEILALESNIPLDVGIEEAVENARRGILYVNKHRTQIGEDDEL